MAAEVDELLGELAQAPAKIKTATVDLSEAELRHKKTNEEFSILESVCHLRDLEVEGYTVRIDRLLAEEEPDLADFDGGRVAAERSYNTEDFQPALQTFTRARLENVARIRSLEPASLMRTAKLAGVGRITLKDLLSMMREHDDGHLETLT
jgi:DinB superfamily